MNRILKLAVLGVMGAMGWVNQARAQAVATPGDFSVYNYDTHGAGPVGRLYTPSTTAGQKYPLVIFFHGAGGGGTDNTGQIYDGDGGNHGQPTNIDSLLSSAKGTLQSQKFFLLCPQSPSSSWSDNSGNNPWKIKAAMAMAAGVIRDYPIDTTKIYVTGLSAGGGATWMAAANYHGSIVAGAAPLSAVGTLSDVWSPSNDSGIFPLGFTPAALVNFPIWIYVARDDGNAPFTTVDLDRGNVDKIRSADGRSTLSWPLTSTEEGFAFASPGVPYYSDTSTLYDFHNLKYSEFVSGGHSRTTWNRAYAETALYGWLFGKTSSLQTPVAGDVFLFDFGGTVTNPANDFSNRTWNSVTVQPDSGHSTLAPTIPFAKTTTGATRAVSLTVSQPFGWTFTGATTTSTAYPATATQEGWGGGQFASTNTVSRQARGEVLIGGLTPGANYKVICYGTSPNLSYFGSTDYIVTGTSTVTQNLSTSNNVNGTSVFNSITSDSKGNIRIGVTVGVGADGTQFGAINALEIQALASGGGTAPTLSGNPPNYGYPQTAYNNGLNYYLTVSGTTPITYSVTSGALPMGITLDTDATGPYLHGTVYNGQSGPYNATITASNGTIPNGTFNVSITIYVSPAFTSGAGPGTATVGVNYNNSANGFTVTAAGYPAPSLSATGVPPGMSFSTSTGKLSGMPTTAGNYTVVVTALNNYQSANHTNTLNIPITVAAATAAPTISGTAVAGTVGSAYTFGYTVTGSPVPTLSVGSGALPPGMAISGSNITGTPTTAGTYTGTIVASNGVGSPASIGFSIVISSSGTLPAVWSSADVGSTGAAGSASYSSGTYTLTGSGADIWGYNDSFRFLYQTATLDGDGSIVAKVVDAQNTGSWAKTGIMMRASMATNSQQAMMCVSPAGNGATSFMYRATAGDVSNATTVYNSPAPIWYKLTRSGNLFTGYSSPTGVDGTWTSVGSQTISMPTSIYVGMVECSTASGTLATAHFSNVTVSSAMSQVAIGSTASGSAGISGGTFSVTSTTGANGDCWGTSDNFYYLYAPMSGDGTVIARVTGMTNTSPYSKSGIMIRKDLTASSAHASVFYTPAQGAGSAQVNMYYRLSQSGLADYSGVGGNYGSTAYLKLVRVGSTVTASVSSTGLAGSYTQLGSQTITGLTGSVYVGLMECSHTATAGTATFDNVSLP